MMPGVIEAALEVARRYAKIPGDHHKAWVIDQMVRILTGCPPGGTSEEYIEFIGDDLRHPWDTGIAP